MAADNPTQISDKSLESPPSTPQGPYGYFTKGTNSPDRQRTSPATQKHPPPKLSDLDLEEDEKKQCSILERLTGSCSIMGGKSRFRKSLFRKKRTKKRKKRGYGGKSPKRTKKRRKKRRTRRKRRKRRTKKRRYRRKSSKRRRKRR